MSVIDQLRTLHDRMAARQPELASAGGVSFTDHPREAPTFGRAR